MLFISGGASTPKKTGLVENSKSSSLSRRESVVEEEKLVRIVEAKTHLQKLSEI